MGDFFKNFFAATRPLSNVKNIALLLFAFILSGADFDIVKIILGFIFASLVCSAFYVFNTISDYDSDKKNKNKEHYSKAIDYFGKRNSYIIFAVSLVFGLFGSIFINIYFFVALILLALTNFLYSSRYTRFKEKIALDVIFGAFLTFLFRFSAFWFIFSISIPPLFAVGFLVFVKVAGYFLYKSLDNRYLVAMNIKNTVTVLSKRGKIYFSVLFWLLAFLCFVFLCINSYWKIGILGILPMRFLTLIIFALIPLAVVYLSFFGIIKTDVKKLRLAGYVFFILVLLIILKLLNYV